MHRLVYIDPMQGVRGREASGWRFRLFNWNILADELAYEHAYNLYPRLERSLLAWKRRLPQIIAEIRRQDPDVICLQEVDKFLDLKAALGPLGFDGSHVQRTGGHADGCATFW